MYRYLFRPITINRLEIKNRIAYPSLGLLFSYDSKLNSRYAHFFRERARGGAGIVTVLSIDQDELAWEQDGRKHAARFDSLILASGSVSEQRLAKALADAGIAHTVVGDGVRPGKLNDAIHGGFLAALDL